MNAAQEQIGFLEAAAQETIAALEGELEAVQLGYADLEAEAITMPAVMV